MRLLCDARGKFREAFMHKRRKSEIKMTNTFCISTFSIWLTKQYDP